MYLKIDDERVIKGDNIIAVTDIDPCLREDEKRTRIIIDNKGVIQEIYSCYSKETLLKWSQTGRM